jgi:hypothetical protein
MTVFVICFCFDLCIFHILFPHHPLPKSHTRGEQPDSTRRFITVCVTFHPNIISHQYIHNILWLCAFLSHTKILWIKFSSEFAWQCDVCNIFLLLNFDSFFSLKVMIIFTYTFKLCYVCLLYTYKTIVNQVKSMEKNQAMKTEKRNWERGWGRKFYYYVHDIRKKVKEKMT